MPLPFDATLKSIEGGLGTLPLAPLCQLPAGEPPDEALARVIGRVIDRLTHEADPDEAARLINATMILTGLRLPREEAVQLFRGVRAMRESSTYQMILEEGAIEYARKRVQRMGSAFWASAGSNRHCPDGGE